MEQANKDNQCKFHPDKPAKTKGLCISCYQNWYRGSLKVPGLGEPKRQIRASANRDRGLAAFLRGHSSDLPEEFTHDKPLDVGAYSAARRMMERFLFKPQRVAAIMQQFFKRALASDKMLSEYVRVLIPHQEAQPPVQVNINTPFLTKQTGQVFDITGEKVKDEKAVDV